MKRVLSFVFVLGVTIAIYGQVSRGSTRWAGPLSGASLAVVEPPAG
jgi:hypothetical protein